jgi:hypothetical protein
MAATQFTARRSVFALGIAIATIAAPAAATFAGASPTVAPRILAGCTTNSEPGNNSLDCEPPAVSDFNGAPSEMYLTDTNPGIASDRGRLTRR